MARTFAGGERAERVHLVSDADVRADKPIVTLCTTVTTHEGVLALDGEAVTWTADVPG